MKRGEKSNGDEKREMANKIKMIERGKVRVAVQKQKGGKYKRRDVIARISEKLNLEARGNL